MPADIIKYHPQLFNDNPVFSSPKFFFTPLSVKLPELYKVNNGNTASFETFINSASFYIFIDIINYMTAYNGAPEYFSIFA